MCVARHAQITQNNKFAISLHYLKEEVSDEVDFLHAHKHESLLWFWWGWSSIPKFPHIMHPPPPGKKGGGWKNMGLGSRIQKLRVALMSGGLNSQRAGELNSQRGLDSWGLAGIILETEGSTQKIQNRALFHYKKFKRAPLNWPPHMFIACLQLFW